MLGLKIILTIQIILTIIMIWLPYIQKIIEKRVNK